MFSSSFKFLWLFSWLTATTPWMVVWAMTSSPTARPPQRLLKKVAVIGATGQLGRRAVQQLVDQGVECNILLRINNNTKIQSESKKRDLISYLTNLPGVTAIPGDVANKTALSLLLRDCQACLALHGATRRSRLSDFLWNRDCQDLDPTHAKQVNYVGISNLLEACRQQQQQQQNHTTCRRIVRITGNGENPNSFFSILINLLGSMAKAWNYEGEQLLRQQHDVEYTIIRPGVMSAQGPPGNYSLVLADNGANLPIARIKYRDVSALAIQSLEYDNVARSTLTASTVPAVTSVPEKNSWHPLLAKMGPDTRQFPLNMLQQHQRAVRKTLQRTIGTVGVLILTLVWKFLFPILRL